MVIIGRPGDNYNRHDGGLGGKLITAFVAALVVTWIVSWLGKGLPWLPDVVFLFIFPVLVGLALRSAVQSVERKRAEVLNKTERAMTTLTQGEARSDTGRQDRAERSGEDSPPLSLSVSQIQSVKSDVVQAIEQLEQRSSRIQRLYFVAGLCLGVPIQYIGNLVIDKIVH